MFRKQFPYRDGVGGLAAVGLEGELVGPSLSSGVTLSHGYVVLDAVMLSTVRRSPGGYCS